MGVLCRATRAGSGGKQEKVEGEKSGGPPKNRTWDLSLIRTALEPTELVAHDVAIIHRVAEGTTEAQPDGLGLACFSE